MLNTAGNEFSLESPGGYHSTMSDKLQLVDNQFDKPKLVDRIALLRLH
jgi:hypothetical protein